MAYINSERAKAAFKKQKRPLKPWEKTALETAKKTERLRALRLAKEAADREAEDKAAEQPVGVAAPDKSSSGS